MTTEHLSTTHEQAAMNVESLHKLWQEAAAERDEYEEALKQIAGPFWDTASAARAIARDALGGDE